MRNIFLAGGVLMLVVFGCAWGSKTDNKIIVKGKVNTEVNIAGLSTPFTSTTNASGIITITYQNPFTVTPNVQANIVNQTSTGRQLLRIYNNTAAGFTCQVYQQTSTIPALLGLEILLASTTNVMGADVDFLITAKQ